MQCCQISNIADPLATFVSLQKSTETLFSFENRRYCRARSCSPGARTQTSLSLALSLCASALFSAQRREQHFQLNTDIMLFASLIWHASIAEITAQLLFLSYVYLILSDDGSILRIFVQINILEGRAGYSLNGSRFSHYFIFIPLSDNRKSKIYQWKLFYWEFSCIKIQYVGI